MTDVDENKIRVGISACLLGEKVRFDGGHKRSAYCDDELSKLFDFESICPELGIGMSVPRDTMRLEQSADGLRAIVTKSGEDKTEALQAFAEEKKAKLMGLSGYIFCAKSPSCGVFKVKVYNKTGHAVPDGRGIFAKEVTSFLPHLPVEEQGRLNDKDLRENFITRVYAYHKWQVLCSGQLKLGKLIDFHTRHKFLILAHSQTMYRELGRLLSSAKTKSVESIYDEYITLTMLALKKHTTRKNQVNVLMHIQGYFKNELNRTEKRELTSAIHDYREGFVPLLVPLTQLKNMLARYPNDFLNKQVYFSPYPEYLKLRYSM